MYCEVFESNTYQEGARRLLWRPLLTLKSGLESNIKNQSITWREYNIKSILKTPNLIIEKN